ncbi:MAG: hypothetical protein Q7S02_01400 [bacterium]|nr:hypothetical protein [bacterium]
MDSAGVRVAERRFPLGATASGALLRTVHAILKSHGGRQGIRGIDVVPGPGTFSRVRLGVVTANALAWALQTPLTVRGRRVRFAKPVYGKPPHITLPARVDARTRGVDNVGT